MNEIFISYSRKDESFVRKLDAALRATSRDPWVDWEDIPLTADWWSEIQAGIEGADAFVFVISPNSTASEVCNRELDHASLYNKRIVPIVYREVDQPSEKVSHLNWIFFRETDDFDTAFARLLKTIDTDLAWVKAHTRLTQRAVEWDSKNRNDSFLLHGDDLADALSLLSQTDKDPPLAHLQKRYIDESRKYAIRRRQITWTAIGVGIILTILLIITFWQFSVANKQRAIAEEQQAIAEEQRAAAEAAQQEAIAQKEYALQQQAAAEEARQEAITQKEYALQQQAAAEEARQEAEIQRKRAEQGQQLATSRELSAQSQLQLDVDPELSILLVMEAISTTNTQQAQSLLQQAIHRSHVDQVVQLEQSGYTKISINPREHLAAIAKKDATIGIINFESGQEITTLTGHNEAITHLAFSGDKNRLASNDQAGTVIVWDITTGEALLTVFSDEYGVATSLDISVSGDWLAIGHDDGTIDIWEINKAEQQLRITDLEGYVTAVAFSRDNRQLAAADEGLIIRIWELDSGEEIATLSGHNNTITALAFDDQATRLASGSEDKTARIWEIETASEVDIFIGHNDAIQSLSFNNSGTSLVTGSRDNTAKIWSLEIGEVQLTLIGHQNVVDSAKFAPEGVIITGSTDGTIRTWRTSSKDVKTNYKDWVTSLDWNSEGNIMAVATANGELEIQSPDDNPPRRFLAHQVWINQVAFSPTSNILATASDDNTVGIWSTEGDTLTEPLTGHTNWVTSIAWHPNGDILASGSIDKTIILWDTTTFEPITRIDVSGQINSLAWRPDGEMLAAAFVDGSIMLMDSIGQPIMPLEGHQEAVNSIAFSPDGTRLASGSDDHTIKLWDIATGEAVQTLAEHTAPVYAVDFSSDGQFLVSGGQDNTAILWDLKNIADESNITRVFQGHTNAIQTVAFHPAGHEVATGSRDRTVRLFLLDENDLQQDAISHLSRWWSLEECEQFLTNQNCPPEPENLGQPHK